MKKIVAIALAICIIFTATGMFVEAFSIEDFIESLYVPGFASTVVMFAGDGEILGNASNLHIGVDFGESGAVRSYNEFYTTSKRAFMNMDDEMKEMILSDVGENELFCVMNFVDLGDGIYPDFEKMYVKVGVSSVDGGRTPLWGKDYRLYFLENGVLTEIPITESNGEKLSFETDKLGLYILYFSTNAYEVKFYDEYPEDVDEPFYVVDNLEWYDMVEFPEVPKKEGYVFTGWKHDYWKGMYTKYSYIDPSNITAFDLWEVYASWCPEDECTPLEIVLDSEKIIKGKEDGCEIILTLSEGKFDEVIDGNVENDWKIVGSDELSIASVERIDDTTAKFTLSGNSTDKYKAGEIQIEFNSELYISTEDFNGSLEVHEIADIQLDENGIKKAMFVSDNSIILEKQKRSSGNGGSSRPSSYTVKFNANGGEEIGSVRVERNDIVTEPAVPVREGYVFTGWYANAELTEKYDFAKKVTESFTLYAAWKEDATKNIVLTVGEKEAVVFGRQITNDVAPVIKNNRVMLPIRFVAEALGAEVLWSREMPDEVKIAKDNTEIVIYIGKDYALVDGEKAKLDSPAFLENDRTYLPIRFVAESLGCRVEWNDETKTVKIRAY